ncbi:hypothetical protein AVEN_227347-1 [Araneus ventricosus]|uniref:Uncharacterized protein n=1 Tax=Araneus ventricosus TaxID=182803 RepID=A0A4Y2GV87_ARAVE|nr:hypothetical protein AVEN_227347-1 [Araneus ventricosus]
MLPAQQPSNMSENESALDVVWICIGFGEFVVDSVIPAPYVDVILKHKIKRLKSHSRKEDMHSGKRSSYIVYMKDGIINVVASIIGSRAII